MAPEHETTVIVQPNEFYPNGINEKQIYDYYQSKKNDILSELNGQEVLTVLKADGLIIKRHLDDEFITMSPELFDTLNNGRNAEFHLVIGKTADYYFADVDPREEFPFEKTKEIVGELAEVFSDIENVGEVEVVFSGGRGFHIYGYTKDEMDVETARVNLKELVEGYLRDKKDPSLTMGVTKNLKSCRIDISTYHEKGSLRAKWSLNAKTGLMCIPVDDLGKFSKEQATIPERA